MLKTKFRRYAALLAVVALLTSAIGLTIAGTSAYFTDSKQGSLSGTIGLVSITGSGGTGTNGLDFYTANMLPGQTYTSSVNVQNTGTVTEDVWMAFSDINGAWTAINTLGMYGKFVIDGNVYDNLSNVGAAPNPGIAGTAVNNAGPCGTAQQPYNYLPHFIKLGTLSPTASLPFTMAFTINACASGWPSGPLGPALNFKIVATQPSIIPSDPFNGPGTIPLFGYPHE